MVDECSGRGGSEAVALPEKSLEVALEKEEATKRETTGDGNARYAAGRNGEAGHV